jgi:hypothetical protein
MEDSVALVEGVPDGMLLADWAERNDVGRTTSYAFIKILRAMGIELRSVRRKGSAKPSQFLGGQALEAMNHLLMQHRDGRSLAQLEVDHCTAITHTPAPPPPEPLADVDDGANIDGALLLKRLKAAELAIATGVPLSRSELTWIIGRSPSSQSAAAARIVIEQRTARSWALRAPADQ